ncbi:hypothetical protein LSH36_1239g00018 [Paralvinella palmiformis]|uniref:C-type lectin domain-containing protein n=1 Tax=Paralvinella palmiformis TaxID=53620 RepID=A0AAD9IVF8_9ANNE|nr:hypothetical protein LSH36_1239g00018 [Paralvinella palmiformis]
MLFRRHPRDVTVLVASPNEAARYCSYVKLCKGIAPEYHDDNCDEKTGPSRILCQYDDSKINSCTSPDSHFGDKCYRKTKYDGQEPNKIDWFNGETYCSQSDIQSDIAYSYLDDDTLINDIINFVDDSKDCILLWLGVRKRIWFWMTGSNIDGDKQPIHYFNWDNNINIDSSEDGCIYIDRYNGNKWFTQNCDDPSLRYFICMNGSSLTTTKAPATAISKSTTETKTSTTIKTTTKASATVTSRSTTDRMISKTNKTTTARTHLDKTITTTVKGSDSLMDKDNKNSFKTGRSEKSQIVGKGKKIGVSKQAKMAEYAEVDAPDEQDDMIDPYGITGDKNTRSADVRQKEAPSGD